jgi:hypothetical protein
MAISKTGRTIIWSGISAAAIFLTVQSLWQSPAPAQAPVKSDTTSSNTDNTANSFAAENFPQSAYTSSSTTSIVSNIESPVDFCDVAAFEEILNRNPEKPISDVMIEKAAAVLQSIVTGDFIIGIPLQQGWPDYLPQETGTYYNAVFDEPTTASYIERAEIKMTADPQSWHYIRLDRRIVDIDQYAAALDDPEAAARIFKETPRSSSQELTELGLPDYFYLCYKSQEPANQSPVKLGRLSIRFGRGLSIDAQDDGIAAHWRSDKITSGNLQDCYFTIDFGRGEVNYKYNLRDRSPTPLHWPEEGWQDFDIAQIKQLLPLLQRLVTTRDSLAAQIQRTERERDTPQYKERVARDKAYAIAPKAQKTR